MEDDAGGEGLQGVVGVVDPGELAGAVFEARGDLPVGEWEVGAELGLVGEGACAGGAGSVVSADSTYFELEVGNDGELAARAVDAEADQAAEDLVAVGRGVGAVIDDEAGVDAKMDRTGRGVEDVPAEGATEGRHASALRGGSAVANAQARVVASIKHEVGREVRGIAAILRVYRRGAWLRRILRSLWVLGLRGGWRRIWWRRWGVVLRGRGHGGGQESQREAKSEGEPTTGGLIHCFKTSVAGVQALLHMRCLLARR